MKEYIIEAYMESNTGSAAMGRTVAELIRCKDCKYGERWAPDKCYCNGFLNAWVDEDDFCAWAERRGEE